MFKSAVSCEYLRAQRFKSNENYRIQAISHTLLELAPDEQCIDFKDAAVAECSHSISFAALDRSPWPSLMALRKVFQILALCSGEQASLKCDSQGSHIEGAKGIDWDEACCCKYLSTYSEDSIRLG